MKSSIEKIKRITYSLLIITMSLTVMVYMLYFLGIIKSTELSFLSYFFSFQTVGVLLLLMIIIYGLKLSKEMSIALAIGLTVLGTYTIYRYRVFFFPFFSATSIGSEEIIGYSQYSGHSTIYDLLLYAVFLIIPIAISCVLWILKKRVSSSS